MEQKQRLMLKLGRPALIATPALEHVLQSIKGFRRLSIDGRGRFFAFAVRSSCHLRKL
jgi:hypothetical protein